MKVDRDSAVRAFKHVRAAQESIDSALAGGASVDDVSQLLASRFDPAIREAKEAGVFVGYFQRWAVNLLNDEKPSYAMVAEPTNMGWEVVPQKAGADMVAGQKALNALIRAEKQALKHARELPKDQARAKLPLDEANLLTAVFRMEAAGVDPIFIDAQLDQLDIELWGGNASTLPVYPFVARENVSGTWKLEELSSIAAQFG
jgi:hypothetical protein